MRRKKKDKNNINNQEEIDLIPIESQQEETEVGTQPDAEPENRKRRQKIHLMHLWRQKRK